MRTTPPHDLHSRGGLQRPFAASISSPVVLKPLALSLAVEV